LSLHALFVLEHNWWARRLASSNPSWNDEVRSPCASATVVATFELRPRLSRLAQTLFQEARKRVIAEMQAITVNEVRAFPPSWGHLAGTTCLCPPPPFTPTQYLPVILGEVLPSYNGYNASVDPSIDPAFAVAAYRYGHSGIDSVYLCIERTLEMCNAGHLLLREVYFRPSYLDNGVSIASIMRGMVLQPESAIDLRLVPDVRNHVEGIAQDLAVLGELQHGGRIAVPMPP